MFILYIMSNYNNFIEQKIQDSIKTKTSLIDSTILELISQVSKSIINCYKQGGKVLFCGNGGSSADAQHLAAELTGRFYKDREPFFAESLSVNTSYLTAVSNDYSYDIVFSRLVKAFGRPGDILISLSTSGKSKNIIEAIKMANSLDMVTITLTGFNDSDSSKLSDVTIKVPSTDTPRIQECHMLIGHIICEIVENEMSK